jgi:tetratricopeptide (TPR) repeat protein
MRRILGRLSLKAQAIMWNPAKAGWRSAGSDWLAVASLIALLALVVLCPPVFADEAAALFQQAGQLYQAGQYADAAAAYEKILVNGLENWQVHYNLGNAYFKQRQLGKAILHYEKAVALNPESEDIRFNLDLANLSVIDRIPVPPRSLVVIWLDAALHVISLRTAAILAAALWVVFFVVLIFKVLATGEFLQRFAQTLLWPSLVALVLVSINFGWQLYERASYQYAIVLTSRVVVTSAPAEGATEVFTLHEGVRVQLETTSGNYQRIRLADGKVGWMPQEVLGKI